MLAVCFDRPSHLRSPPAGGRIANTFDSAPGSIDTVPVNRPKAGNIAYPPPK